MQWWNTGKERVFQPERFSVFAFIPTLPFVLRSAILRIGHLSQFERSQRDVEGKVRSDQRSAVRWTYSFLLRDFTGAANIINALSLLLLCAELLIREYRFVYCGTISSYGARDTGCTRKCMRQESSSIIEIVFEEHIQMTNLYGATRGNSRTLSISLAMCPTSTCEVVTQGYS